jgi:hypothetical protein
LKFLNQLINVLAGLRAAIILSKIQQPIFIGPFISIN